MTSPTRDVNFFIFYKARKLSLFNISQTSHGSTVKKPSKNKKFKGEIDKKKEKPAHLETPTNPQP